MRTSRVGGLVAAALVVIALRPAASETCREEERDARGNCPVKKAPPMQKPPAPKPPAPKPPAPKSPEPKSPEPVAPKVEPVAPKVQPPPPKTAPAACPAGMVSVPAGTFQMGWPDGSGPADEHPQHAVTLTGYCIDKTEVTVKAFAACVTAGKCSAAREPKKSNTAPAEHLCNGTRSDRADHPVNCVDWNQATAYCDFAGKRLPTEAEWEYAAKGTDGRRYPWGNDAPSARWLNACGTECVALGKRLGWVDRTAMYDGSDGWESTAPVGSFPDGASPFGALDMAGNVREWTVDWYGPYAAGATSNPGGASTGDQRSNRGGSWDDTSAGYVRAANRNSNSVSYGVTILGFRCARGN